VARYAVPDTGTVNGDELLPVSVALVVRVAVARF
jgi:hypothetical protein